MAKVLVEISAGEGRDAVRLEGEGQKQYLLLHSQPLGEVFREDSFGGVLFVLLPLVLLHPHQPAIILKFQTRHERYDFKLIVGPCV